MNTDLTSGYYRRIYAGYLTGKRINSVSMEAEAWFWRLHSIADDYGNLHGDPLMLCSLASPRREMDAKRAEAMTKELVAAGLTYAYYSDDDVYLHIVGFETKQPAGRNGKRVQKCPMNPDSQPNVSGESKQIQTNPSESYGNRKIQVDHSYSYSHSEKTLPEAADAAPAKVVPPKKKPAEKKPREPDPIRDALAEKFFPSGVSKSDGSRLGRVVQALKVKHATAEEICRRVARWPTVFPDTVPGLEGFERQWDRLASTASKVPTTKPRRNEGIANEKDDHVYQRAMKAWIAQGNQV